MSKDTVYSIMPTDITFPGSAKYLSVSEAAKFLGLTVPVIRTYLWRGLFTTFKFKSLTLLSVKELKGYEVQRSSR